MSLADNSGEFFTLVNQLQHHSTRSKLLQKVRDETHRVLREIRVASCVSQSTYLYISSSAP